MMKGKVGRRTSPDTAKQKELGISSQPPDWKYGGLPRS